MGATVLIRDGNGDGNGNGLRHAWTASVPTSVARG